MNPDEGHCVFPRKTLTRRLCPHQKETAENQENKTTAEQTNKPATQNDVAKEPADNNQQNQQTAKDDASSKASNKEIKIEPVSFQLFYGYNQKGLSNEKERFNAFISGIKEIIKTKGQVSIELEGSASTVPTKTYGSNKKLALERIIVARDLLTKKLTENGIELSKFKIVSENSLVQGPKYQWDYLNKKKYAKYQYIKIAAF